MGALGIPELMPPIRRRTSKVILKADYGRVTIGQHQAKSSSHLLTLTDYCDSV